MFLFNKKIPWTNYLIALSTGKNVSTNLICENAWANSYATFKVQKWFSLEFMWFWIILNQNSFLGLGSVRDNSNHIESWEFESHPSIFKQNLAQPINWLKTIDMVPFLSQNLTLSFKINFQFKVKILKINFETYREILA